MQSCRGLVMFTDTIDTFVHADVDQREGSGIYSRSQSSISDDLICSTRHKSMLTLTGSVLLLLRKALAYSAPSRESKGCPLGLIDHDYSEGNPIVCSLIADVISCSNGAMNNQFLHEVGGTTINLGSAANVSASLELVGFERRCSPQHRAQLCEVEGLGRDVSW